MVPTVNRHPSPIDITETLDLIFSFLSQKTLKSVASRVCRQWFFVARKHIRRHLHLEYSDPKVWGGIYKRLPMAGELSIGRTIGPWLQDCDATGYKHRQPLDSLLHRCLPVITNGTNHGRYRVRILNLNLEGWFWNQERTLTLFQPTTLLELSLDVPRGTESVKLGFLLNQCPNLMHLSVSAYKCTVPPSIIELHPEKEERDSLSNDQTSPMETEYDYDRDGPLSTLQPFRLRSLRLNNLLIPSAHRLKSYWSVLPQLAELYLLQIIHPRRESDEDVDGGSGPKKFAFEGESGQNLWKSLAKHCPHLTTLHFHCRNTKACQSFPVEFFPRVQSWGVDSRPDVIKHLLLEPLKVHRIENRLTTLVILQDETFRGYHPPVSNPNRDEAIRKFLVHSPSLLHFKAGRAELSPDVLWDTTDPTVIWACRRLRTLSMRVSRHRRGKTSKIWTGCIFGYISRVCPHLQELSLTMDCQVLALESGVCLLTRLRSLRRLELVMDFPCSYYDSGFHANDLSWIVGRQAGPETSLSPILSNNVVPSFLRRSLVSAANGIASKRRGGTPPDPYRAYTYCINKFRKWSMQYLEKGVQPAELRAEKARMLAQQERNKFESDYDRAGIPMVDGLEDLDFLGTSCDIEGCLKAQIYRLQHQYERDLRQQQNLANGQDQDCSTITRSVQPWAELQQLIVSQEYATNPDVAFPRSQIEERLPILKRLRPDIEILTKFLRHIVKREI
ncbi:hypothetical protein BGZ83_005477 [Gryganskiella cystojenkinii]|nr:hypothetical protein BGZ83_005477 [Gryganskiella cystojenkinii]